MTPPNDDQMIFLISNCPNGHRPGFKFTAGELRELIEAGRLRFWCYHCDTYFPPPLGAIVSLRRQVG
jgi:hypothetical protein